MSRYHRENPDAPIKHEWFEGARQHAGFDPASGKDQTVFHDEYHSLDCAEAVSELIEQHTCLHENFACECDVNRLSKTEGGPINRFTMDVRVKCSDCGLSFRFIGLPAGLDLNGAATSIDACEGRFAIAPKGQVISVLEGEPTGFSVRNEGPTESDKIDMLTDRLANFVDNAIRKGSCATHADWQAQIHALLTSRR